MKKSTEIKNELDNTTKRLDELTEMRDGVTTNLQTLQQGFIDGKTLLDEVQAERGKLATLDASINTLEAKQSDLHTDFQRARNVEAVQTGIGKLKTIAEQAGAAFGEWDGLRVKLNETISNFVDDIFSKSAEFYGKQKEFRTLYNQLEERKSGIDIDSELKRLGVSEKSRNSATTEQVNLSPCKFGQSIFVAETLAGQEKYRQQHAIEKEEFEARRAETQAAQKAERQKAEANQARQLEAARRRIIRYRIDNELPPLSPQNLDIEAAEIQSRSAKA